MSRSVPSLGLRAVALAAVIGGQTACVQTSPIMLPARSSALSPVNTLVASRVSVAAAKERDEVVRVVVRDYWNAFQASVVAWNDDEQQQGLRSSVLRDGTVAYDHQLYFNAYVDPSRFTQSNWFAFSDAEQEGHQLQFQGIAYDQFNCVGKKGCSPVLTWRARVPDAMLRASRDSLVVKVVALNGYEELVAIPGSLITAYLATVDSVSAFRKAKFRASNQ